MDTKKPKWVLWFRAEQVLERITDNYKICFMVIYLLFSISYYFLKVWDAELDLRFFITTIILSLFITVVFCFLMSFLGSIFSTIGDSQLKNNLNKILSSQNLPAEYNQLIELVRRFGFHSNFKNIWKQIQEKAKSPAASNVLVVIALRSLKFTEWHTYTYTEEETDIVDDGPPGAGASYLEAEKKYVTYKVTKEAAGINKESSKRIAAEILANHPDNKKEIFNILKKDDPEMYDNLN